MTRTMIGFSFAAVALAATLLAFNSPDKKPIEPTVKVISGKTEEATFAMGCFWHSEEMFDEINGVLEALPGYSGGTKENPSYDEVCTGETGHAEVVNVVFDPSVVSYEKLVEVFFAEHDPTTLNAQYPDVGTQYRSAVFYHSESQKETVEKYMAKLREEKRFSDPIVTEITKFKKFYPAEKYHHNFAQNNPNQSYVACVTRGQIEKFRKDFPELLKKK
jgi:peptide-methionine (S)-S-oxide reductase